MNKKLILTYLAAAFGLAYIAWGIVFIAQELNWFQYGTPISVILVIFGANVPALSSYFALKKCVKGYSLKTYLKDAFGIKQKVWKYILMFLFVAIFFIVPALTNGILNDRPPFVGGTDSQASIPFWITLLVSPLFFFLGGSEEMGWRYLLQPEFEKRLSFFTSTIMTAVIWAFWHFPLFFIIGTAQNSTEFLPFVISCVGLSFASSAIYHTTRSAWLSILFHCITNALQGTWALSPSLFSNVCTSLTLIIISLLVVRLNAKYLNKKKNSIKSF